MVSYISQTCNKTIKIRQTCSETKEEGDPREERGKRKEERGERREKIRERRDETWAFIFFLLCGMGGSSLRVFFT